MSRYLKIWWRVLRMSVMKLLSYKWDSFVALIGFVLSVFFNLMTIFLFFYVNSFSDIAGFSIYEFYFVYSISQFVIVIMFLFVSAGVSKLAIDINEGNLDFVLVKPIKPWMLIFLKDSWWLEGLVILIPSFLIFMFSLLNIGFRWTLLSIFYVLIIVLQSTVLLFLFNLLIAFLSFYWDKYVAINILLMNVYSFSRYPGRIYPYVLQGIFSTVVPVLLIASPIYLVFEGRFNIVNIRNSAIVAVVFFVLSIVLYNYGLRRYKSAN